MSYVELGIKEKKRRKTERSPFAMCSVPCLVCSVTSCFEDSPDVAVRLFKEWLHSSGIMLRQNSTSSWLLRVHEKAVEQSF